MVHISFSFLTVTMDALETFFEPQSFRGRKNKDWSQFKAGIKGWPMGVPLSGIGAWVEKQT